MGFFFFFWLKRGHFNLSPCDIAPLSFGGGGGWAVGFLIVLVKYRSALCSFQLRVKWWRSLVMWTVERSYLCSTRLGVEWGSLVVSGSGEAVFVKLLVKVYV